ncbi:MAG: NADH-quinone oxidoreductase subunit N [Candidatus Dormibacteria bacterium]
MIAGLPALVTPGGSDVVGILPELILATGFVALMLLDLVVPPSRRGLLAVASLTVVAASFATTVWCWYDAAVPHTVYSGSIAYDRFSLFLDAVVLLSTALVLVISPQYLNRRGLHHGEYYALILGAATGMMLLAAASSLMVMFLAYELLSIALYLLSGFSRNESRSLEAGLKYLLLGGFASAILLFGMALVYGETGHTQLQQIAAALSHAGSSVDPLLLGGIALVFVGFAFKISAAPFHSWSPDVYQGAPTSVTAFMSVATKVAAFGALIRLFSYTFGESAVAAQWKTMVFFVAIVSMVVGNVAALRQSSVKRMLAYSGIAQAGYILIGVVVVTQVATVAALYYLAAYAVTNLGAFAVITLMANRGEDLDRYDSIRGLAFRRPYVAAAMGLFLLSLGGFPPTAGFFGKFFVFSAAIQSNNTALAIWGIATSAISAYYYLRVALLMYQEPRSGAAAYPWSRTSVSGALALTAASAGTLVLGVFVSLVFTVTIAASIGVIPAGTIR